MKRDRSKGLYSEKCSMEACIVLCFERAGYLVPRDVLQRFTTLPRAPKRCVQRTLLLLRRDVSGHTRHPCHCSLLCLDLVWTWARDEDRFPVRLSVNRSDPDAMRASMGFTIDHIVHVKCAVLPGVTTAGPPLPPSAPPAQQPRRGHGIGEMGLYGVFFG